MEYAQSLSPKVELCACQQEVDVDTMSKTPPNRRGITFEVGATLEARDALKNWYPANIEKIDYDDEKVLIHYRQWSHRYDEWFDWTSPYLRPVERIQLRRQGLLDDCPIPVRDGFHVNDKVLASWSDCRFYPAKVLAVNKDASYTVKFYDGVVQTVKGIHVKPFVRERGGGKARSTERNGVKKPQNGRDRRPQEYGPKNKRTRRSTSDQEGDSDTEDGDNNDEDEWHEREVEEKTKRKDSEGDVTKETPSIVKQEEDTEQHAGQNNLGDHVAATVGPTEVKMEEDGGQSEERPTHLNEGIKKEEMEMKTEYTVLSSPNETKPSTESPNQMSTQTGPVSVPLPSAMSTIDRVEQKAESQPDSSKPAPLALPVKPIRKQGFHNPNRFSREPLYRVIKNQPPPVLSINLDHNPFKCSAVGCTKSFRKAKLLHYHMKYYHGEEQQLEDDLSPTRSAQTRASEKHPSPTSLESPKRRRTISASMHSNVHSPTRTPPSPRSEAKTMNRRTSAPPAVNTQQQRALLREKSKENQLDRNGQRPVETETTESSAVVKGRDRLKDKKQREFLRINLKKKKKKKKAKCEYTGSEENIDISIFALQSKLNLPLKFPLSHNHKPESYHFRPGYNQSEQMHVDDEDSISDWSTDSCEWSDDELGAELDNATPPLSLGSVALETSTQEVVRCVCEAEEENDFMIQCEECLCWQHGTCMGLLEENVPDKYACYVCRDPPGQRQSLRYRYDRDWLSSGHMYGLSFLDENYSHQNAKKIAATHQLLGDVQRVVEVLNGLQLKMSVLQTQTHPDLQLWCQPWKRAERPWRRGGSGMGTDAAPSPALTDEGSEKDHKSLARGGAEALMSAAMEKLSRASSSSSSSSSSPYQSFQDSYIMSEHCYQKPRAYYPAVEQRLVVETTRRGSELEDSLRSTEDLLEREQRYGGMLETARPKAPTHLNTHTKGSDVGRWGQAEVKREEGVGCGGGGGVDGNSQQHQWQINLLDHIDAVQDEVTHRMDFIERELDVLESWLDYTGELEPPEPLARLPQLKHRMKLLLTELAKVQQIALCCST
ncbi:PHD finger protein 20 isoform X1 [Salmo salar]|uniref:PHD finger protein 20 isoform X1 n=2 Tax=Salmo salar TaxID=8030 RepID=A0ABM3CMG7_SALSA|nr:PHD finger protein 20 isoform X1 [Salmo salar]XP_045547756.1 PHD finger protein 20 isoform X1 [Salmo salar]